MTERMATTIWIIVLFLIPIFGMTMFVFTSNATWLWLFLPAFILLMAG